MQAVDIIIAGGGLSGLYAAWLLEREGVTNYVVLEAREAVGGRIRSFQGNFDLGPTWYWPGLQPELDRLIHELGLSRFAQYQEGDMVIERTHGEPPVRLPGYITTPQSMRIQGGMSALVTALSAGITPDRIVTGQRIQAARKNGMHVEIDCEDKEGSKSTWRAHHLLLAIPPRLTVESISFSPALPPDLRNHWHYTATWMAPHAKYVALYERPFWRDQGLSGEARSAIGVLGEIHDASMPGGEAALFGFFRLPPEVRGKTPVEALHTHCRAQFGRLFGREANTPIADYIQDWAEEAFTATKLDQVAASHQTASPEAFTQHGAWQGCMTGIASEWSSQYSGYLAGAIEAARVGVRRCITKEMK